MFSLDLDHLNILVMLILAFFSFRSYRGDALALEYESQEEMDEVENQAVNESVEKKEENAERGSEMVPQSLEVNVECTENHPPVKNETLVNAIIPHEQSFNSTPISIETVQPSSQATDPVTQKIVQQQIPSSIHIEKDSDEESTLLNRNTSSLTQNDSPCDEEEEDQGIFSSDTSSVNSSSCPSSQSQEDLATNKKEKRKIIQKAKRKLKKDLKKKELQQSQHLIHLIQLQ